MACAWRRLTCGRRVIMCVAYTACYCMSWHGMACHGGLHPRPRHPAVYCLRSAITQLLTHQLSLYAITLPFLCSISPLVSLLRVPSPVVCGSSHFPRATSPSLPVLCPPSPRAVFPLFSTPLPVLSSLLPLCCQALSSYCLPILSSLRSPCCHSLSPYCRPSSPGRSSPCPRAVSPLSPFSPHSRRAVPPLSLTVLNVSPTRMPHFPLRESS
ncbi:unnamed protein product [Closterium sp. NIES-54]